MRRPASAASTPAEAPPGTLSTPPALAASTPAEVREPPVNLDKLRLTDSIATPIPNGPARGPSPPRSEFTVSRASSRAIPA
ncbi:MAG: hypothetical protein IPK29_07960 [Betaproteobacteria bacterium]|nr:hypothetical protein [Betaproteobacteria bacterium]